MSNFHETFENKYFELIYMYLDTKFIAILSFHVEIGWMEYKKTVPKIIKKMTHL